MNEKELEDRIRWLNNETGGNIDEEVLADDFFLDQPTYEEEQKAFRASKYHERKWKWHQLVRIVLEKPEKRLYMYEKVLALIHKHQYSFDNYFELKTEEGTYHIPNALADLNRLEILSRRYFGIYGSIKDRIHFDSMKTEYSGPNIRGKIDWHKTVTSAITDYPLLFKTTLKEAQFITPENILLILCAEWMHRETTRILQLEFPEPLSDYDRTILANISNRTGIILLNFPIPSLLSASRKYWGLQSADPAILEMEILVQLRITQGAIRNPRYEDLLVWIQEFRQLDIPHVSANTPTRHILESIENLDTVYEVWIFMEFIDYLHEKHLLIDFRLRNHPYCRFEYHDKIVTLWYEKVFAAGGENAWAVEHVPDFTAMVDDQIIALFDAKNYGKSSSIRDAVNKMLSYLNNLDSSFGALIFPNHPKFWDDLNMSTRMEQLLPILESQNTGKTENEIKMDAKNLCKLSWSELPDFCKTISPPNHLKVYSDAVERPKRRFHINQKLCLLRMSPTPGLGLSMKNQSLETIFEEIVSRIS